MIKYMFGIRALLVALLCNFGRTFSPSLSQRNHHSRSLPLRSQLLEFVEPTTGVTVRLVGAMHYNPVSIGLARTTIKELAEEDRLGSVVIESCDLRWETTMEADPLVQKLLLSEMRAAHDLALEYKCPLVLGDQRINVTTSSMGNGFKETFRDLAKPLSGWNSFWMKVTEARRQAVPLGDGYLNSLAFLDPKLLAAAPVALVKYPLSFIIKSPIPSIAFLSLLFYADSAYAAPMDEMTASDWLGEFLGWALETAIFARVFLKELLVDRNVVLARNILEQCRYYQESPKLRDRIFRGGRSSEIVYADGSVQPRFQKDKVVVAVLGLAHCNGIKKILEEQSL